MQDRGKFSDNAASHGMVPPFFPLRCQRPDRGPPSQSLCNKENRSQSNSKRGLGQIQLQLPTGIPFGDEGTRLGRGTTPDLSWKKAFEK